MRPDPVRVAIDLETTGLRPDQDAIIEIGAVKFAGDQILDTFQSFVSLAGALPYRIQRLTGITAADLRRAPQLGSLLSELRGFIGSAPLVGHSVAFDATFLRRFGLAHHNPLIDTYELASMLLPDLPSYALGAVGEALQVPSSTHHRALADADLSRAVFLALLRRLDTLDTETISELAALPAAKGWTPAYLLKSQARVREEAIQSSPFAKLLTKPTASSPVPADVSPAALTMAVALDAQREHDIPKSLALTAAQAGNDGAPAREPWASVGAFMRDGGCLLLEVERKREAQECMLVEVVRGAAQGQRMLIAAASADDVRLMARTLLPRALALAGLDANDVRVEEIDEREGYLCLRRWFGVARDGRGALAPLELTRGLARLTVWARETHTGSRADIAVGPGEWEAWARVRGGGEFTEAIADCPYRAEGYCFTDRAEKRASEAAIVVTTHATLVGHLLGRDSLLPDVPRVIALDGRQIEDELRRQQTVSLDAATLLGLLDSLYVAPLGAPAVGLLPLTASLLARSGDDVQWFASVTRARQAVHALFGALRTLSHEPQERPGRGHREGAFDNGSLRVDHTLRASSAWVTVKREWQACAAALSATAETARVIARALEDQRTPRAQGARMDLLGVARRLDGATTGGYAALDDIYSENLVRWLRAPQPQPFQSSEASRERRAVQRDDINASAEATETPDETPVEDVAELPTADADLIAEAPAVVAAPVQVGAALAPLWETGRGLALIGWSLSVGGDFEYVRGALALPDSTRALAATPDYSDQTLLCLPTDISEPAAQSYHAQLEALIISIARALDGNVVAVFPSHAALRTAAMGITRALERQNILTLAQGIDGSARQLWNTFNGQPRTVLLGAGAFWDGADVQSRAPACVVITRTPFPPQSDPLVAARADRWDDQQAQFMTPQAALKLRQALGGLAWSHGKRNAVVLADKRLQTRGYGATILGALPQCDLYQAPLADLAERIGEWTRE